MVAIALGVSVLSAGCGATVRDAAREATKAAAPTAIDQSLRALEDEGTRQRIAQILATPEMQRTVRELAAAATQGATDGLTSEAGERTSALANAIVAAATRSAVDAALQQLGSPANAKRAQELAASAASAATHAAIRAMAEEMPRTLGPAARALIRDELAPTLREVLSAPDTREALGRETYELSRQAVFGSNQALAELAAHKQNKGLLARVSSLFADASWLLPLVLASLVGLVFVLSLWLVRVRGQANRYKHEIEQHGHEIETRGAAMG